MLRYIDEGQFDKLPAGIYARAWIRTVAATLGLDPNSVLDEVEDALRPAAELFVSHAKTGSNTPVDSQSCRRDVVVRTHETAPSDRWRRSAAAAIDGLLLSAISAVMWMIATGTGGPRTMTLEVSGVVAVTLITVVVGAVYFLLFAGVGGRTPGAAAMGCPSVGASGPLNLSEISRRALDAAILESSLLIDWIVTELPLMVERRRVQV
jgi:hypothetical protein